eukprot:TRINITY_DN33106_c0_g1_i1.p1 TRINITY_DN33106_c0_g1~~TRINITY_DN33106_c0_g1_i1.p1  ORF type:complete len:238 (+),score=107.68 TRINITY_DN33106_c0_g1_i1:55-768(+)
MDVRIGLELRGKKKSEITELDLSNCKTGGEIDGLNEEFSALEHLDLQNASLTNIKLFPKLANLKKLDLSGNRLSKGLEVLKDCPKLTSLSLTNNKFKDMETLKPLSELQITQLDVDGNEFPEPKDEFRKKVFEMLPSLLLLDGANKDGVEEDNSDDDDDEEDDEDDSGDEEESEDEDGPGLSALYDNTADLDDDDEADYDGEGGDEESADDEDEDDEEDDTQQNKGVKRKHEGEEAK